MVTATLTQAGLRALAPLAPVMPVVALDDASAAVDVAEALLEGGLGAIEVTLRTPQALDVIEALARRCPDLVVGAGTVRTPAQARAVHAAGARFAVSPGFEPSVAQACLDHALPLLPGVATASEVMAAQAAGFDFLKFFPAEAAGGVPMLAALAGPFPDVAFCPTGGLTAQTAPRYLALANVPMCGASWLVGAAAVQARDWGAITRLARSAAALKACAGAPGA